MSLDEAQFVEISHITITDSAPQQKFRSRGGDYRIIIKHEHGTEETIPGNGSREEVNIDCNCKTFIQLNTETTIHIHRSRRFKSEANGTFIITAEEGKEYSVTLSGQSEMGVILKLGEKKTMAQVFEVRVQDANEILKKESRSAEELERVTGHLKILVNVCAAAVLVNKYANAAVSVAKLGFEKIEEIPAEYRMLKTLSLECMKHFEFDKDAREVYTSDRVRKHLNSVMKSVIEALEFIFHHYSQSRRRRVMSKFTKSTLDEVKGLASKLEKQKAQITNEFLLELRGGQRIPVDQERPLERDRDEARMKQKEEGWVFVDNAAEPDLLKRFLGTTGGVAKGKDPCLPGTRVSILEKLLSWAQDDSPEASRLFWLYGIAGCGKSAVALSTCQTLLTKKRLAGTFFCRRDEVSRRNPVQLFGHLAFCLAEKSPAFKDALVESLEEYRILKNDDPSMFVEYALKKPLSIAKDCALPIPVTFVIDALDECNDSGTVAGLLAEIAAIAPRWIRLIVTSREQPDIENPFINPGFPLPIDKYDLFADDARNDIRKYLLKRLGPSRDPNDYICSLAEKSGGLFIWLHTVTEVILSSKSNRSSNIRAFLDQPLFGNAEGQMAATYLTVLEQASGSSHVDKEIVRIIVGLLFATSSNTSLTINGLYSFLPPSLAKESTLEDFGELVIALKPVLKLTPISDGLAETTTPREYRFIVQTHHASFLDFCAKREISCKSVDGAESILSNVFWTDSISLHRDMAMGCLEIMKQGKRLAEPNGTPLGLRFNICGLDTSHKLNSEVNDLQECTSAQIPTHLLYSSLYWARHILTSCLDESAPAGSIDEKVVEEALGEFFGTNRSLFWLEILSITGNVTVGIEALVSIATKNRSKALSRFSQIASEMSRFVDQCFPAISTSTPHLYLSLMWLPVESQLWTAWNLKTEFSRASVLKDPIQQPSGLMSSTTFPVKVDTFAVSPDEKNIATGSADGHVRLWDIRSSGIQVKDRQISTDSAPIGALAYTPNGSRILCVCGSFIYELEPETLLTMRGRTGIPHDDVRCMAVSQVHIALGTEDGKVVILDAKTYHEVSSEQPYEQTEAVEAISFSPDGSRLVYSSVARVRIWDVSSGSYRPAGALGRELFVTAVAFSIDGKKIATGGWWGNVRLCDAESGEEIGSFSVKSPVQFLTFSYGTRIICALASKLGGSESDDLPLSSEGSRHYVFCGYHFWAEETSLQIWDVDFTRRQKSQSAGHSRGVSSVAFSPDGQKIVSGSDDRSVRVWDAGTGEPVELHSGGVRFVTFSPDGKFIASGGNDNVIRIWDAQTGKPVQILKGHTDNVNCGTYSPDRMRFVSGSDDCTLRFWDMQRKNRRCLSRLFRASGKVMTGHNGPIASVAFSPDDSCIASASYDSTIRLWDGKTGNPLGGPLSGHDGRVYSVAFSWEGTHLASGGDDKTVCIWDVRTRTRSAVGQPLQGHTSYITSVAFSLDGAFIFSASSDGTIRCWDVDTGSPVGCPLVEDPDVSIRCLAVSPDGHRIVSGSSDGSIRVWDSRGFEWEADTSFISCGHLGPDRIPDYIPEDGWIRTPEGGRLLWVPAEHRKAVCRRDHFSISTDERKKAKHIMWDALCHDKKWTDIRVGQ